MGKYLNIGLLTDDVDAVFTREAIKGAELGAIAIDANIFIFPGMYLDDQKISGDHSTYEYQFNTLFDFARDKKLDIIYVMLGMIGSRISVEKRLAFLEQYTGIPVVTLYTKIKGYPSIIFDNRFAFMQEIRHLIADHHVNNMGYVSGPKTNVDAMERLEAYRDVLKEQHIPSREDYVIYGNFEESTEDQIRDFLVKHPELDALVFANDRMALGGYRAMDKLNIRVGQDILVVSFDNSEFASNLKPPLTTVEANATELSYEAVIHARDFLNHYSGDGIQVKTHVVHRSSCGCHSFDFMTMAEQIGISQLFSGGNIRDMMSHIHQYLFGTFTRGGELNTLDQSLQIFVTQLLAIHREKDVAAHRSDVEGIFARMIDITLFRYTTAELFTNLLIALQHLMCEGTGDPDLKLEITRLFEGLFRNLAISNWQLTHIQKEGMSRTFQLINNLTVDMLRLNTEGIPYESALDSLSMIGVKTAYLYLYDQPIHHTKADHFEKPDHLRFRAYYNAEGSFGIPESESMIPTSAIFDNPKMPENRRLTIIFHPLYSGESLYGLIAFETHSEYFRNIAPVSIQISVAIKSMQLLRQQKEIQKALQENLDKIAENNQLLDRISKTDPLTGLNNRRGFMEQVEMMVASSARLGKNAVLVYGDLDGLKKINDHYGHSEGDFAIREAADILREAFRATDVIARFGGDEFVVFALMHKTDFEPVIKKRLGDLISSHNAVIDKPYIVSLSTGIAEGLCDENFNLKSLMELADHKLYIEKKARKTAR